MKYFDAFVFEKDAVVTAVNGNLLEFDDTVFYPGGGGQPCDTGVIICKEMSLSVVEVFKTGGKILHKVGNVFSVEIGDKVHMIIDKQRREKIVRMHTGEHILFKSLETVYKDIRLEKIELGEHESSLFIRAHELNWQNLFKAEELANKIISEDRSILEKIYTREDAFNLGGLRINKDRIDNPEIRVVEIQGFDRSACAGTHAKTTGYVGNVLVTHFYSNKGLWELKFKTNVGEDLFLLARVAREVSSVLETGTGDVVPLVMKIRKEAEDYKLKFRRATMKLLDNYDVEKIKDVTFISLSVDHFEKKQLLDKAAELLGYKRVVCFVNQEENKATVMLSVSQDLNLDAHQILKVVLDKFNGKGGGKKNYAAGSVDLQFTDKILQNIKSQILNILN